VETSSVFLILKFEVFGATRKTVANSSFFEYSKYSLDSSIVISGKINPSVPASFAIFMNFLKPFFWRILEYVIINIGRSGYLCLVFFIKLKQRSGLIPFCNALNEAS
jgi:hypothetical protein